MGSTDGRSNPGGFSNLKLCNKRAKTRKSSIRAKGSPKQARRPAEKGRKRSNDGAAKLPFSSRNLLGLKLYGSSQISGSCILAERCLLLPYEELTKVQERRCAEFL
ncbi:hypothetical protein pdam_00009476 [Pocillopora damicornis]|uniref:Uncharacterized protein n=1 Tax=Pocillopora damicornis TaxID=46731 RepID=A0A3M6TGE0_POCDA|nr:hypothetical protein pdam_00009476 [Pocillopora damicornis]